MGEERQRIEKGKRRESGDKGENRERNGVRDQSECN